VRRPRVDVGIVTWNTRDLTVAAVRRLLAADSACELRVLVRDHASSDGTADALSRVPGVEVERHDANPGFAAGVNALVRRSDAPWFLALNSDAWPEGDAVRRLVAALERAPAAAVVSAGLRRPDGSAEPAGLPFPGLRQAARGAARPGAVAQPATVGEVDWVVFAAVLLRRAALDEVGPLDESFHMYAEDLEWCWRARSHGWQVLVEPAATVVHVGNASGAQATGEVRAAAVAASTDAFLRRTRGRPVALAYRALAGAGAARQYTAALLSGDRGRAAHWRRELGAQVRPGRRASRPA
jgi:N-acetylglucosaminyl-diphospho-decaprenol L-rhamnosyltransferase